MTRLKAFAIHFSISLTAVSALIGLTLWVWYPQFFANASGVWQPLSTIILVDVVLGPLMTLILYKKGKPGLMMDLSIVAILQISAFIWALWMLYSERPVLVAYHDTIMICLNPEQAQLAEVADPLSFLNNDALVAQALLPDPKTPEETQARAAHIKALPAEHPSLPVYSFGKEFQPLTDENLPEMLNGELDLKPILKRAPIYQQRWDNFIEKHPDAEQKMAFFILVCGGEDHFAAVDPATGVIKDAIELPFLNSRRKHPKQ